MKILGFDWDEGNRGKCEKHGLELKQIEGLFHEKGLFITSDLKHSGQEPRYIAIGRVPKGKPASVVFTIRNGCIRPISARYMHEKEIRRYEKIHPSLQDE